MSNLSSARFPVDEAQIREGIISSLRDLGLANFPGQDEAAREAAFQKWLTDTLSPIVYEANCQEGEDPKWVARAIKAVLEKNSSNSNGPENINRTSGRGCSFWFALSFLLAFFDQIGFGFFSASMVLYNFSLDKLSNSMSRSDSIGARSFKYCAPVLGALVFGFILLANIQSDINSALCYLLSSGNDEYTDNPITDRSAWCDLYHKTWLRNQLWASNLAFMTCFQAVGFYLFAVCKLSRLQKRFSSISRSENSNTLRLIEEFSASTSFQGYLNAAQEEPNGNLRDAKFKMVKAILKAICENLDPQVFQVVPYVPQNPLSINSDDLSVRLVGSGDASQTIFGASELSRGLLREPSNANTRGGLVFSQQASSGELIAPNYQLSQG